MPAAFITACILALSSFNLKSPKSLAPATISLFSQVKYIGLSVLYDACRYVVANLTAELKASGLWNNSILLFLADNGGTFEHGLPVPGSSNFPLRGHKYVS